MPDNEYPSPLKSEPIRLADAQPGVVHVLVRNLGALVGIPAVMDLGRVGLTNVSEFKQFPLPSRFCIVDTSGFPPDSDLANFCYRGGMVIQEVTDCGQRTWHSLIKDPEKVIVRQEVRKAA
ncbi:MAG: hypothetical protein PHS44_04130 [Candidatus Dojkabacteria bacterium]|jgi:hypothetical protein|nr:hypothetical protein [Candidatus Dojkabacteria bacterium]